MNASLDDDWIVPAEPADDWVVPAEPRVGLTGSAPRSPEEGGGLWRSQLRSGLETMAQGAQTQGIGATVRALEGLDRIDRGEQVAEQDDPLGAAYMDPTQRAGMRARLERQVGENLRRVVQSQEFVDTLPRDPNAQPFVQALDEGRWGDAWRSFTAGPGGIVQQLAVESLPNMLPPIAAGLVAGPLGAVGAGFLSDQGPRMTEILGETMREAGVDTRDPAAMQAWIAANPGAVTDATNRAGRGAAVVGAVDGLTQGLAQPIVRGLGFGTNARRALGNTGREIAFEGVGEAGAGVASGQGIQTGQIVAEMLGAGPASIGTTAAATAREMAFGIPPGPQQARTPTTTAQQAATGLSGITAPGSQTTVEIGGQTATVPPPPTPAGVPTTTPPAAPQAAPPSAAAPPPPPAAATPPASSPAVSAAPGAAAPTPEAPAPGAAAVPPAAPTGAAPGAASPAPGAPSPVSSPSLLPSSPSVAPPPVIDTTRPGLEAMLNDPRPAAQIEQDRVRERQQGIETLQQGLPLGWRVVDEDGAISVLDPNGEWAFQYDAPPADPSADLAEAQQMHQQGLQTGLYSDAVREGDGTRTAPVQAQNPGDVDAAAGQAAAPTPAQAQAGNYAKGHLRLHGMDLAIENPRGSTRSGVDRDGRPWSVQMPAHYGYVKGTTGRDGDQVDVYLGPRAEDPTAPVFVVDQVDADTGRFDEHKVMLGFDSQFAAVNAHDDAFSDGRGGRRRAEVTRMTLDEFKAWMASGAAAKGPLNREAVAKGIQRRRAVKAQQRAEAQAAAAEQQQQAPAAPAATREEAERQLRETGTTTLQNSGGTLITLVPPGEGGPGWKIRSTTSDGTSTLGGNPVAGGFSRDEAIKRVLQDAYFAEAAPPTPSPQAPSADALRGALASLARDDRELLGARLERLIKRGRDLTWRDIPQDMANSLDTASFATLKAALAADPRSILSAISDLAGGPTEPGESPAGSTEIVEGVAEANGLNLSPDEVRQAAALVDQGMSPKAAILQVTEAALTEAVGEAAAQDPAPAEQEAEPSDPGTADQDGAEGEGAGSAPAEADAEGAAGTPPPGDQSGTGGADTGDDQPARRVTTREEMVAALRDGAAVDYNGTLYEIDADRDAKTGEPYNWFVNIAAPGQRPSTLAARSPLDPWTRDEAIERASDRAFGRPIGAKADMNRLAQAFGGAFIGGRAFASIAQARTFAARVIGRAVQPGTPDAKLVDEAVEAGVVMAARLIVQKGRDRGASPAEIYRLLVDLYGKQPRVGVRTADSIERQAYSTPAPLAWIASQLAGVTPQSVVLEPTAGTGMLLIGAAPKKAIVNEIDGTRAQILALQGFDPTAADAAGGPDQGSFAQESADAVLANPPFGAVRESDGNTRVFDLSNYLRGYDTRDIDHVISLRALEGMKDDGRAVLILGGVAKTAASAEARSKAYQGRSKREFFFVLYRDYRVTDHFTVSGDLYARQGAAWPVDVIVIEGRGKATRNVPAADVPRVYDTWDALEEVLNDGRREGVATAGAPAGVGAGTGSGPVGGAVLPGGGGQANDGAGVDGPAGVAGGVDGGAGSGPGGGDAPAGGGVRQPRPGAGTRPETAPAQPGGGADGRPDGGVAGEPPGADGPGGLAADGEGRPGGARGDPGDDAGGMAGSGVQPGAGPDVAGAFEGAFAELFGEDPAPAATMQGSAPTMQGTPPAAPAPTAGQAATSAVKNAASGADDAMSALTQLFGGGKQLNTGLGWNEDTWKAAKPLFLRAIQKFRAAAADARQAMLAMMKELRDAYGWTKDMVLAARAYMERFVSDVVAGRISLDEGAEKASPPAAPAPDTAPTPAAAEQQRDEPTEHQVPYEPVAGNRAIGTLTPRNIQSATREALQRAEKRAGKPLLNFVADKMGMTAAEAERAFSAEQVDALALAIQRVDDGEAFVIGDQTGVGKGRFVAGMLRYALQSGLVPVFVTEKANLYRDMVRDLTDIGMPDVIPQILPTNANLRLPLAEDSASDAAEESDEDTADGSYAGPMIRTPSAKEHVASITAMSAEDLVREKKIVFSSYSQLQGSHPSLRARVAWFNRIMPGSMLVLDEAHNATGGVADPTATRQQAPDPDKAPHRGINFQGFVEKAKGAVFSSATAAKRPQNMLLYAMRTALRRAVSDVKEVPKLIARGGVPVQQIITRMMAEGGFYLRRERSFAGVTYETQEVPVRHAEFDRLAESLRLILEINEDVIRPAIDGISGEIISTSGVVAQDNQGNSASVDSTEFAALMHNIIKQGLLGAKAAAVAAEAVNRLKAGERPVIALSSTMGSFIQAYVEMGNVQPGDRVDLPFNALLQRYLRRLLLVTIKPPGARSPKDYIRVQLRPEQLGADAERAYRELDKHLGSLDFATFALSPIDRIRSDLIAAGYKVGEITGRQHAVDYDADGKMTYRVRGNSERSLAARLSTIQRFNDGQEVPDGLDVVILNQAGATGLSLHASPSVGKDTRKRVMMIAQADDDVAVFMQMLGRVHRTGQIITPSYVHLAADVPAEMRPAAALAKRMASLNANTTANRKSAVSSDDGIDFLNDYGDEAAATAFEDLDPSWQMVMGIFSARDDDGNPREDIARRTTGRANLLPVAIQREFMDRLIEAYKGVIEAANEAGTNKLEAKSLPLDAVPIDGEVFVEKKGATEFEAEARITRYDVARVRKMPAPGQIVKRVLEAAADDAVDLARDMSVDDAVNELDTAAMGGRYDDRRDGWLADVDASYEMRAASIERGTGDPDKARAAKAKEQGRRDQVQHGVRTLRPGRLMSVMLDANTSITAMVMGLRAPSKADAMTIPSSWEVSLLTADGVTVRRPLSAVLYDGRDGARAQRALESAKSNMLVLKELDAEDTRAFFASMDEASKASREERFIITGNLVAALDKVKGTGQIVFFSERGRGNVQGILLPADWSLKKFKEAALPSFLAGEATDYLTDPSTPLTAAQIRLSKDDVRVARTDSGTFLLSMPSSKKAGGRYFQDKALQAAVGGSVNMVTRGDRMLARMSGAQLRAVMRELGRIATATRQEMVSDATEAKAWLDRRRGGATGGTGDGIGLYANPFDPALFNRLVMQPLRAALGGSTALNNLATRIGGLHRAAIDRVFRDPPLPANTTEERRVETKDLTWPERFFKTPERLFHRHPPLAALVRDGMRAEQNMQVWRKRLTDEYETIRTTLRRAGGDWQKVAEALYSADAEGVDLDTRATAQEFYEEQGLTPAEATATANLHALLMKQGRLVDQHRRAMLPTIRRRKAEVWRRMQQVLNSARVDSDAYQTKYRRRVYLNSRIKAGKGDLAAQAAERDRLTTELMDLRTQDPEIMARHAVLAEEYDALEARLAETSIRSRIKGYFPHKFYGSWRLFQIETDADGNETRREITSDQGFYDSRGEAIIAARAFAEANPGARLHIEPRKVSFPEALAGTPVSDANYRRISEALAEQAALTPDEVRAALKGNIRRRSRRRTLAAAMKRAGAEGFAGAKEGTEAEMADRVLRTHINQIVRYVTMDRLKMAYVTTTERMGLSPGRLNSIKNEGRLQLFNAVEAWWRDVNGAKQGFEETMDSWLQRMGLPGSTLAAAALGATGGAFISPYAMPVLGGYLGYRMFRAMQKGGEFPTRSFIGAIVGDVAHLKLGMFINLASAAVNLTQTAVNTYPVLGEKWTAVGMKRAAEAMWSMARNADAPGRMSEDAHILRRLDVVTDHRYTEENEIIAPTMNAMRRLSMFWFERAERMNRATAALGAYHRALDEGASAGEALQAARDLLTRTQFHQGLANRPELLRQQITRLPLQFWNFMFQQIAFAFGLKTPGIKAYNPRAWMNGQVGRMLLALFIVAGALGLAGMQVLDWLLKPLLGDEPSLLLRLWAIDKGAAAGPEVMSGLQVLLRGFPSLMGVDITERVGMGKGFLPDQWSDFLGAGIGSLVRLRELARREAPIMEQLGAITPVANQAREIAGAVTGDPRTSGFRRGYREDEPTTGERVRAAMGVRPIGRSLEADVREGLREATTDRRRDMDRFIARIVAARREGRPEEIGRIRQQAAAAGITLTQRQIVEAVRDAERPRAERDIRRTPRDLRPEVAERMRAVEQFRGAGP